MGTPIVRRGNFYVYGSFLPRRTQGLGAACRWAAATRSTSSVSTTTVRALSRLMNTLGAFHSGSVLYDAFVWMRWALNSPTRRFRARAVFAALSIYLDIINLFVLILELFSSRRCAWNAKFTGLAPNFGPTSGL